MAKAVPVRVRPSAPYVNDIVGRSTISFFYVWKKQYLLFENKQMVQTLYLTLTVCDRYASKSPEKGFLASPG